MKNIYLIFAFSITGLLASCGGSENKEAAKEEKADASALAASYCECLSTVKGDIDSCAQLSINYALKLATDKEGLEAFNKKTEECTNARLEADMNKAMEGLDELEKKATAE